VVRHLAPLAALVAACAAPPTSPSDDPSDWQVDTTVRWVPKASEATFIIPTRELKALVDPVMASNNNVDITLAAGRLFLGWRTAPTHFASTQTQMHLISSADLGQSWTHEASWALGSDVREPHFLNLGGTLRFHFFQGGEDMWAFEPRTLWRTARNEDGTWGELEPWGEDREVTWLMKVRGGVGYRTSYIGAHYVLGQAPDIRLYFTRSTDGLRWEPLSGDGVVYRGGVSEAAFELDAAGDLWAVTRNEDGDATGFGSHVCVARKGDLGTWECSAKSDPERYDSPKMFRHGDELYLVARRDVGGPFDQGLTGLSFGDQQTKYLADYWGRPKRTALYQLDRAAKKVQWVMDFPSAGDTAFPSIVRLDAHRFLIANYTSPIDAPDISWVQGQTSEKGTRIYLVTLDFEPAG
jgi:hypothetical protein